MDNRQGLDLAVTVLSLDPGSGVYASTSRPDRTGLELLLPTPLQTLRTQEGRWVGKGPQPTCLSQGEDISGGRGPQASEKVDFTVKLM